jgi:hypothetical protein
MKKKRLFNVPVRGFLSVSSHASCGLESGPQIFFPPLKIVLKSAIVVPFSSVVHTCCTEFLKPPINVLSNFVEMLFQADEY